MGDLRRREATNVGVLLFADDLALSRFLGERPDGSIDGRRVRWAGSSSVYKAWVDYWRHHAQQGGRDLLLQARLDDNYFVEVGGERLLGAETLDAASFLDYLFGVLVEEEAERQNVRVEQLCETVIARLGIQEFVTGFSFETTVGHRVDEVSFDYRYDNGAVNLMQRGSLIYDDDRSWDVAHSLAWVFERARSATDVFGSSPQLIALLKSRPDDPTLRRQLGFLGELAEVVDVGREEEATERLGALLHLGPGTRLL